MVEKLVRWLGAGPAGVVDGAWEKEALPLRLGVEGEFEAPKLKLKAIVAVCDSDWWLMVARLSSFDVGIELLRGARLGVSPAY